MFDIGIGEVFVILVVALLVFGPDRLPVMAKQAAAFVRDLRTMVANARRDLSGSVGDLGIDQEDLKTLADLRNPRSFVRKKVLDGVDLGLDDLELDGLDLDDKPGRKKSGANGTAKNGAGKGGSAGRRGSVRQTGTSAPNRTGAGEGTATGVGAASGESNGAATGSAGSEAATATEVSATSDESPRFDPDAT